MLFLLSACSPALATTRATIKPNTTASIHAEPRASPPKILSAHLERRNAPEFEGLDGLLVVFSHELAPTSVTPEQFVVRLRFGETIVPDTVTLAPANEADENRSVMLIGSFTGPEPIEPEDATDTTHGMNTPTSIAVVGPLYSEDGVSLERIGAEVLPPDAPSEVVLAYRHSSASVCDGRPAIRTFWSDTLRGVEPDDLTRITLHAESGPVHPSSFDDHEFGAESNQDNVLDLCFDEPVVVNRLVVESGVFQDPMGIPSAAVDRIVE